jgi:hypothetical protein
MCKYVNISDDGVFTQKDPDATKLAYGGML